jgi:CRISPR-associated protein Cas1
MWWQADAPALARIGDRVSTVYVEHAVVGREQNSITVFEDAGSVALPAATIAALLLGPGTRITHGAVNLLGDSGTSVCWVGEQGVRMYAHGVSTAHSSHILLRQAWLVSDPKRRIAVARRMYQLRFGDEDVTGLNMQQLRGREGVRVRRIYRDNEQRTGVAWRGRNYVAGNAYAAGDTVNRMLSALNACLYGVAHAAIAGVGASPGLGFVHTGNAISFVLDVADLYKAESTIPLAFDITREGVTSERTARQRFRDIAGQGRLLPRVVGDVLALLNSPDDEQPTASLWGDGDEELPAGHNYGHGE